MARPYHGWQTVRPISRTKVGSPFIGAPSEATSTVSMKSDHALNAVECLSMEGFFPAIGLLLILKKHIGISNRYNSAHKNHLECIFSNLEENASAATAIDQAMY
jgi:hypothetical protein